MNEACLRLSAPNGGGMKQGISKVKEVGSRRVFGSSVSQITNPVVPAGKHDSRITILI